MPIHWVSLFLLHNYRRLDRLELAIIQLMSMSLEPSEVEWQNVWLRLPPLAGGPQIMLGLSETERLAPHSTVCTVLVH